MKQLFLLFAVFGLLFFSMPGTSFGQCTPAGPPANVQVTYASTTNVQADWYGNGGTSPVVYYWHISTSLTSYPNGVASGYANNYLWVQLNSLSLAPNTQYYFIVTSNNCGSMQYGGYTQFWTPPAYPGSISSSMGSTINAGQSTTLTVAVPSGTTYWYSGSQWGNYEGNGSSITVSPTSTTTYYVTNAGNTYSSPVSYTVNVNEAPFVASALSFDGVNDFVNLGNVFSTATALTIETWIYLPAYKSTYQPIVQKSYTMYFGISESGFLHFNTGDGFSFNTGTFSTSTVPLNSWVHVAVTWNYYGGFVKYYINGNNAGTQYFDGPMGYNFEDVELGSEHGYFTTASFDELRIWEVERTNSEISNYKNCEIASNQSGLIANYHFNEASYSSTLTDFSGDALGNFHNGLLSGFAYSGSSSNWIAEGAVLTGTICVAPPTDPGTANSSAGATIISGQSTVLTVSSPVDVYWNTGNCYPNGTLVGHAGMGGLTVSPTTATVYYAYNWNGTQASTCASIYIGVSPAPMPYPGTMTSSLGNTITAGETTVLTVPVAQNLLWYTGGCWQQGGVWYNSTGSTGSMSVSPSVTTTYYAMNYDGNTNSECSSLTITVNQGTPGNNAALNFNNRNEFIDLGSILDGTSVITFESWIKLSGMDGNYQPIFDKYNVLYLGVSNAGKLHFNIGNGGNWAQGANSIATIPVNTWIHVAASYDGTTAKLYINGVLDKTVFIGMPIGGNGMPLFIGKEFDGMTMSPSSLMTMDELRIWTAVRTESEIASNKDCEISGTQTDLYANYHFNESGTTLTDASGNNINGTLVSFDLNGSVSNWVTQGGVTTGTICGGSPQSQTITFNTLSPKTVGDAAFNLTATASSGLAVTYTSSNPLVATISGSTVTIVGAGTTDITASQLGNANYSAATNVVQVLTVNAAPSGNAALNFDGTNDFVDCGNNSLLNFTNSYTIEAWFKLSATNQYWNGIVSKSNYSAGQGWYLYYYMGALHFSSHGEIYTFEGGSISLNQWTHVAVVNDNGAAVMYINGVSVATLNIPVSNSTAQLNIGARNGNTGTGTTDYFPGSIDEVRIWNIARTASEIQTNMNCETSVQTGLVANYHFNESGTSLTDASGNAGNGTLTNFALTGTSSNWVAQGGVTTGTSCSGTPVNVAALNFDGTNDYVTCGNFLTASYTKEAWIKLEAPAVDRNIISGNLNHAFWINANGYLDAGHNQQWSAVEDVDIIPTGTWTHVAVTYDAVTMTMSLYKNGVMVSENTFVPPVTSDNLVYIGAYNGAYTMKGSIDEVRIWDYARSATQIQEKMNCEVIGSETGILAGYHFNQSGSTLSDVSIGFHTGTLNNFALTGTTSNWVEVGGVTSGNYCVTCTANSSEQFKSGCAPYSVIVGIHTYSTTGTYVDVLTNMADCDSTVTTHLTVHENPIISVTATDILCNGGNATVTVTASGNEPPFDGTGTFTVTAGTHPYSISDDVGCSASSSITITEPAAIVVNATATDILCNGDDAIVTVTATGGPAPFTGTGDFNVGAGTHNFSVTDDMGCSANTSITITQPTQLLLMVEAMPISCNGGTSSVFVAANGGIAPYQGVGPFTATAGFQEYFVTDANGCSAYSSVTVTEPTALAATVTSTTVSCNSTNNGTATVSATGGVTPYIYAWSNNSTAATITGLTVATYTITITDANGCNLNVSNDVLAATGCITKVRTADCGTTVTSLAKYIYCDATIAGASDYEWKFENAADGFSSVKTKGSGSTAFYIANIPGIENAKTYSVSVRGYRFGAWGEFSTACSVTTPPIPTTTLTATYCGATTANLTGYLYCTAVAGAVDYEWNFTNAASGFSFTRIRGMASASMLLSSITGLEYATTYNVIIKAQVGTQWGNYGTVCTITTPPLLTSKVRADFCGIIATSLSQYIYCDAVTGAVDYEWNFANTATGFSFSKLSGSTSTALSLSAITGLKFGLTYNVTVRVKMGTQWGAFGTVCTIATPAVANTQVRADLCGTTTTSLTQNVYCVAVKGAMDYEWEFVHAASGFAFNKVRGIASNGISLALITGLTNGKTYNVRVKVKVGSQWGNFSDVCTISTPSVVRLQENDANEESKIDARGSNLEPLTSNLELSLSPNPVRKENSFIVSLKSDNNINGTTISVYNIIGQIVYTQKINVDANNYSLNIDQNGKFTSGLFIVQAEINGEVKRMKLIVE